MTRRGECSTSARSGSSGLVSPFSDEVHFGERVGLIGPNGSGKSELMRVLAGRREPDVGELVVGPRVSTGFFTQTPDARRPRGRVVLDVVLDPRRRRWGAGGDGGAGPLRPRRGGAALV